MVYCAGALNYNNNTDHVIVSTNSGTTWTDLTVVGGIQPHTDSHSMAFDSSNRMLLGNDGGIWRYDPAGPSWTNLNGNLNTIQFTGIGIHPTSTQTVIGGSQDNGTELTTGSAQWNSTDGGDGGYSQISQTNASIIYSNHPIGSFGLGAFLRKSTNGGTSWTSITPPSIGNQGLFNFYAPIFVDPSNGNRIFLGGDKVYESPTAGCERELDSSLQSCLHYCRQFDRGASRRQYDLHIHRRNTVHHRPPDLGVHRRRDHVDAA